MTTNQHSAKTGRSAPRLQTNPGATSFPRKREPTGEPPCPRRRESSRRASAPTAPHCEGRPVGRQRGLGVERLGQAYAGSWIPAYAGMTVGMQVAITKGWSANDGLPNVPPCPRKREPTGNAPPVPRSANPPSPSGRGQPRSGGEGRPLRRRETLLYFCARPPRRCRPKTTKRYREDYRRLTGET